LKRKLESLLTPESIVKALNDPHARRRPRPCGFTIHTGIGCSLKCAYCYIEDMGFEWSIREYPLNSYELAYALLSNPYLVPGLNGSLLAIGSVTEPFHGLTRRKTIEYVQVLSKYLGNPIQFSTKMYITRREALEMREADPGISPLVTIITLKYADKLEPYAPKPDKRFEAISNMREAGLKPFLFLRPMIPGLIEDEYTSILDKAAEHGAVGVVAGSLRITEKILERLSKLGIDTREILRRASRKPRGRAQIPVDTSDLKSEVMKYARKRKLLFFSEACMANMYSHGLACWKMIKQGLAGGNLAKPPYPTRREIAGLAEELGVKLEDVRVSGFEARIWVSERGGKEVLLSELIHSRYRVCTRISYY